MIHKHTGKLGSLVVEWENDKGMDIYCVHHGICSRRESIIPWVIADPYMGDLLRLRGIAHPRMYLWILSIIVDWT